MASTKKLAQLFCHWVIGSIGLLSHLPRRKAVTSDLIFKLVFQANSGWVQQQLIAIRREVRYLFSSFLSIKIKKFRENGDTSRKIWCNPKMIMS